MSTGNRRAASTTVVRANFTGILRPAPVPSAETSTVEVSIPEIIPIVDRGKRILDSEPPRPKKRTSYKDDAMLLPNPVTIEFNPFAVLDLMWLLGAVTNRNRFVVAVDHDE